MQDLLMLWDAIFADSISFDLVDYVFVAMLLYIRDTREFEIIFFRWSQPINNHLGEWREVKFPGVMF